MEKIKNFFRKVGSFCKSTFLKVKGWAIGHKIAAITIAAGSVVAITLAIVLPVTLSHKKESTPPAHVHTFASEWSHDDEKHWHAATCGHDVKIGEAAHTWGDWVKDPDVFGKDLRECSVCGVTEQRDHVHDYKPEFEWQKTPEGAYAYGRLVCSIDPSHIAHDGVATVTEVDGSKIEPTASSDGSVKYSASFTYKATEQTYTEEKTYVLHNCDEHGFCTVCGEYGGETFELEEPGSFMVNFGKGVHAGSKLYFRCDFTNGHALHQEEIEYALEEEITAYIKDKNGYFQDITWKLGDELFAIDDSEDGYIYFEYVASADKDSLGTAFVSYVRDHLYNSFNLCLADYEYKNPTSGTKEVGVPFTINTTGASVKDKATFRFPIEANHHYYIELEDDQCDQLDYGGTNGAAKAWFVKDHKSTQLSVGEAAITCGLYIETACTPELLEIGDDIGQGYIYYVFYAADPAGMNITATIKDDHFECPDFERCIGEIPEVQLDEEVVLGEVGNDGHRHLGTDEPQMFRIKSTFGEEHKYYIDANNIPADEVNVYYLNQSTGKIASVTRTGENDEYFIAPDDVDSFGTLYFSASPIAEVTDASITITLEEHPEGLGCATAQGFCKYHTNEYLGSDLSYNTAAESFTLAGNGTQYFKIAKDGFEGFSKFRIQSTVLDLSNINLKIWFMSLDLGRWDYCGGGSTFSANDITYSEFAKYHYFEKCDGYFYLSFTNKLSTAFTNINDFVVFGSN